MVVLSLPLIIKIDYHQYTKIVNFLNRVFLLKISMFTEYTNRNQYTKLYCNSKYLSVMCISNYKFI